MKGFGREYNREGEIQRRGVRGISVPFRGLVKMNRSFRIGAMKLTFYRTALLC